MFKSVMLHWVCAVFPLNIKLDKEKKVVTVSFKANKQNSTTTTTVPPLSIPQVYSVLVLICMHQNIQTGKKLLEKKTT